MSICVLQLPPDFEERYKKYRAELSDKHKKRTQDVATETKERTTRDFATSKFGLAVKEKLSRVIAEQFTTNEIVNVFADANIPTDKSLFAKWKITLDAFGRMSEPEEGIPHILEVLCHPLNFQDPKVRKDFVKKMNAVLAYDKLEIFTTDKDAQVLGDDGFPISAPPAPTEAPKTSTDYVKEALNFFKDEYNKVRISGLTYEYPLGDNFAQSNFEPEPNAINYAHERKKAVERLKEVGFIGSYEIDERVIDDYGNVVDYAICKIDESKLTQKEAPSATAAGVNNVAETIVRHYHHFDNSIQEKGIDLNHKFESDKKESSDSERRQGKSFSPKSGDKTPENFSVAVKDREIWINDFLLRKPHAIGKNKEFFDYVFENDGKSLEREKMPDYVKQEVGGKGFSKVLNDLGFKGEILKAFFPERGKSTLLFRKTVTVGQLEKAGIRVDLFLQELRTAHTKNSPI